MISYVIVSLIAFVSYGGLLVLVFQHGLRKNRSNQIFALYLFDMVLQQVSYLMVSLAAREQEALFWYTLNTSLSAGQAVLYFFFTRAFLRLNSLRTWIRAIIFVWLAAIVAGTFLYPGLVFSHIDRHETTGLFIPQMTPWGIASLLPMMAFWGWTVFRLSTSDRTVRSSLQRVRIQYVLLSILVVWVGSVANASPALRPYPMDVVANIVGAVLIAYAILRYQLLDIRVVIRKGLFYSVSVVSLGTSYLFAILVATRFFHNLTEIQSLFLSFVIAILAALVGQPIRDRAQLWIDRIFFRERYDGTLMTQRLGRTVTSLLDLEKLADIILNEVTHTMHIGWAAVLLEQEGEFRLVAQKGLDVAADLHLAHDHPIIDWLSTHKTTITGDALDEMLAQNILPSIQADELGRIGIRMLIPLRARDRLVGALGVGAKRSQQSYSQDDEVTLTTLANQVSIAIDNAQLYDAVQQELAERRRAEESLRQSEEKYRLIAENVADIVWTADLELNLRYISPSITQVRGYTIQEGMRQRPQDIFTPASLTVALNVFAEEMAKESIEPVDLDRSRRIELEEYCQDGSTIWTENTITFLRDAKGKPIGIVGITRDISERKEAEAERERLIAELEAKNTELERFTFTVSHDLKSPLITIKGFLGFLAQDTVSGDASRIERDMAFITNAVDKMQQLLDELLELSRIGRLGNPPEAVSTTDLAHEAAATIAGVLHERDVQVSIVPDMPVVVGDRTRLRQVFENLLGNAAKFMGDQPQPQIEVGARESDGDPVFYVRDNGIGIDARYHKRIFDLFEKLDPDGEGTGIGLAIVQRIVETHGGRIWVESEGIGRGSCFCFTLGETHSQI